MKRFPLLLVHGYPFDHTLWFSVIASFGSMAKALAPDLPGFGANPVLPEENPSLEGYADYLARYLDSHHHDTALVAGMSMGGYIALAFAEKYPERVKGLGLISTQAAADTPEARENRKALIQKIRENGTKPAVEAILPKLFSPRHAVSTELAGSVIQTAERAGVEGLAWALAAMAERPDRGDFVKSLDIPVLVAHGSEDALIPIAKARALAENCRKPLWAEIRGAGHATPLEEPDQLANALGRLALAVRDANGQPEPAA